ncbi:accessory Sec system protein Asp2 [Latilactobacillus curvatus]|uniref:accessory Sec system protein Asp2 n=1 Tax=Latilactobacillus curvatus TaxID=28038 RepID=UPI0012FD7944|nr:accessory Sec system protein Asp2 [Latilactobacillus curvatus]
MAFSIVIKCCSPGYTYRVAPAQEVTGDVDWCLTFNFADKHNRHQSIQINQNQPFLTVPQSDAVYVFYTVLLSASGTGRITFRGIDMTLMRTSGTLVSGDQETTLALGDAVHSYYYPGTQSIKPKKLIVTFAGFRAFVRKFELVGAFQKVGQPFLAFTDFRAHGGAFYMNRFETTAYEERVKAIILERLSALGLTTDDLIITGQSMGSTAAIYYGALLNAGNVVVTKPIINLGTFTSKGDLAITEGVSWMFETRRLLTGRVSVMDQDWLNALVTTAVAQSERKTIYSLFALLADQYDGDSIDEFVQSIETTGQLGEYFWEHGRHTEKSGAATVWLFDQIQNIIQGDDKR